MKSSMSRNVLPDQWGGVVSDETPPQGSWRSRWPWLVGAGLVAMGCWALFGFEAGRIEERLREREAARVGTLVFLFNAELRPVITDLHLLAEGDRLQEFLLSGAASDRNKAAGRAALFSRLQPDYDQIRYLDEAGFEVFRINRGGIVVPGEQLQDKSERPYFKEARALARGQVYLSKFDLNVENDRMEEPLKSMIRFAVPVFDGNGRPRGIYVINYLGNELIARLAQSTPLDAHQFRLLNAEGYWLKGATPAEEWGFMLPERAASTLARSAPALWSRMSVEPSGHADYEGGLLTWQRLKPGILMGGKPDKVVAEDDFLLMASFVSPGERAALVSGLRRNFLFLTPALLLLVGTSYWFCAARQKAQWALRRSEENLKVTLHSIGDAVLATDTAGNVTLMNRVAEQLTGWSLAEARGRPIAEVFNIINEETRLPAVILVDELLVTGEIKGQANHTVLIARDGTERAITDIAAPIHDHDGRVLGVVKVFRDVTETRQAQEELDRFFSLSLDFLCISSADGTFKRVSPAVTDILGWTVPEFLARPYLEQVHPDDLAATIREVDRQMATGKKVLNFENRYQHKNGSWRILSWRSVPHGRLMYATARDVTERRQEEEMLRGAKEELERRVQERTAELAQANESLRHSERRFRALIEHSGDSIALIDEHNLIKYLSPSITAVEGYAPEELLGRSGVEHTHPDDLPLVEAIVGRLIAQPGQPIPVLWRRRHKNGKWLWLEGVATNLLHDPAVGAIVTNYRDVTERKRTEQALAESEEHFRFLNDLAEVTRSLTDPKEIMAVTAEMLGRQLHASRCAYADVEPGSEQFTILHDYTDGCASTVGEYQLSLFGPRAGATLLSGQILVIRDVAAELRPTEGADMFNAIGIQAIITCPLVKDGRLRAMMAVHQTIPRDWQASDIALVQDVVERCWATLERRTAEEKLARLNIELEQRVVERTAQLETANKELEAFSHSVSHDLRAPLRHVQGYVELLVRETQDSLPDKARRYLKTIADAGREMGELIDDLLTFSRMNRVELSEATVDLNALVAEVKSTPENKPAGRVIRWKIAELPKVQGDAAMLRQVLVNLLSNAVKYTRGRNPAEIEVSCSGEEKGQLVFCIRDNGAGFDMKYADKLFGVFQRLHRADEFEGTGIGLANVRRIITRHGGRTWAEGRVGSGATFYFTLQPALADQPPTQT